MTTRRIPTNRQNKPTPFDRFEKKKSERDCKSVIRLSRSIIAGTRYIDQSNWLDSIQSAHSSDSERNTSPMHVKRESYRRIERARSNVCLCVQDWFLCARDRVAFLSRADSDDMFSDCRTCRRISATPRECMCSRAVVKRVIKLRKQISVRLMSLCPQGSEMWHLLKPVSENLRHAP